MGIGSPGEITLAANRFCGKSLGFRVAMNAARPFCAQEQSGLSPGSGEISLVKRTCTNSASSLSKLMTAPTRLRRTPSLLRTSLYSARISPLTSHVKLAFSSQSRRNRALGFCTGLADLNPEIPATRTEVSITPLGRSLEAANCYLRQPFLFGTIRANRFRDSRRCDTGQVSCGGLELMRELTFPS